MTKSLPLIVTLSMAVLSAGCQMDSQQGEIVLKKDYAAPEAEGKMDFSGITTWTTDDTCRPGNCLEQCSIGCTAFSGGCASAFDLAQECLKINPPEAPVANADDLLAAMDNCLQQHPESFGANKCMFWSTELDHHSYDAADPEGVCRQSFSDYRDCLKSAPADIASIEKCQGLSREVFEQNQCALYTKMNYRRLYGRGEPGKVQCYVYCK